MTKEDAELMRKDAEEMVKELSNPTLIQDYIALLASIPGSEGYIMGKVYYLEILFRMDD